MKKIKSKHSTLFLLSVSLLLSGCCPHRFVPNPEPEPLASFYVPEKIRVALVLGSGGVRGTAHAGVIQVLEENGIRPDLIVGCSAGSIVGAIYAEHPDPEYVKEAVWGMRTNTMLDFELLNCRFGLSQGRCMHHVIDDYLEAETFEELLIPLVIVATDLHSGELVAMGSGDLVKSVQSSCSIPFVFVPCEHLGRILVDGGTVNPVPARIARDLGADIIITVDLCELLDKTFPTNLLGVASRSAEIAFMWQNEACCQDADVVIRPKTCGIGAFNDTMKQKLFDAGRNAALAQLPKIKELLAKNPAKNVECNQWRLVNIPPYTPAIYHGD